MADKSSAVLQHLALATSLVKLAELEQASGRQQAAAATAQEADALLSQLSSKCQLTTGMQAKAESLRSIMANMQEDSSK